MSSYLIAIEEAQKKRDGVAFQYYLHELKFTFTVKTTITPIKSFSVKRICSRKQIYSLSVLLEKCSVAF